MSRVKAVEEIGNEKERITVFFGDFVKAAIIELQAGGSHPFS